MPNIIFRSEDLTGKDVIDSKAIRVGRVKNISFDLNGAIGFVVETIGMEEKIISRDQIAVVGDIILLKPEEENRVISSSPSTAIPPIQTSTPQPRVVSEVICSSCKSINKPGANYCRRCGSKILN